MNNTLEWILKHPIKTAALTGTGIILSNNISKAQDRLEGTITDPLTKQGLHNQQIDLELSWDGQTITDTIYTTTNINGYYIFDNITGIEDEQSPNNKAILKYYGNKIFTNNFDEKTLKIYTTNGQEVKSIKTSDPNIEINLDGLASGRYLTVIEIDKKAYANLITADAGKIIGFKKLEDFLTQEKNNQLNKIAEVWGRIKIQDSSNTHHSYYMNTGNWSGSRTFNLTLPPVIPLQIPFTDPEVQYQINNLMDLWKYMSRITDENDYRLFAKTLWPMGIFTDTSNTPTNWKQYINNAVNIVRDSLNMPADSILTINNEYTEPNFNLGYSTVNVAYLDSTTFKNIFGENLFSGGGFFFDNTNEAFIGYQIYLNTDKITNPIDAQKYILRHIQKYVTQTVSQINNPNYLGQTGNTTGPGPTTTYNEDEKTLIKQARNMSPNIWINRFFNPGTLYKPGQLYKPETPNGYERKGHLLIPKENIINTDDTIYKQMKKQLEQKEEKFK